MEIPVIVVAVVIFVLVLAISGFKTIQQAETMVVERLGRYHRTLTSGINILWPVIDRPRSIEWRYVAEDSAGNRSTVLQRRDRIDLRETVYDFPRQSVITKDNVVTEVNAILYYQITDPARAVYEIANLPDAIEKLTQTTLRNVIGEMDLDETLTSRDTINAKLRAILDDATDKWGVKVNRVELQDISPPADIKEAMEKQMRAERDRRASILTAEGVKASTILQAEGLRDAAIAKAEGEKQANVLIAQGVAAARTTVAQAEAEAIASIGRTMTRGDSSQYLIALRYIEALKEMVSGKDNKVIYLPYEATGILSSIGGIKDMFNGSPGVVTPPRGT